MGDATVNVSGDSGVISVLVPFRNAPASARNCVQSLLTTHRTIAFNPRAVEYVFVDDASDEASSLPALLLEFRETIAPAPVRIVRFRRHLHYTHAVAAGLSLANGENVLMFSHDMIITPPCLRTLLEVAAARSDVGIIRARSQHMDCCTNIELAPPLQLRDEHDVEGFASLVRERFTLETAQLWLLIGDAMLIKRSVVDRIGVPDTRFVGFMGDIDYGLRAQRAGFELVIALGAWVHHLGGGVTKNLQTPEERQELNQRNRADAAAAWQVFKAKWTPPGSAGAAAVRLPETHATLTIADVAALRGIPRSDADALVPPLKLDDGGLYETL